MKNAIRDSFKQSGKRAVEMSKSFAVLGAIFSLSECCIDKVRPVLCERLYSFALIGVTLGSSQT
jgi:hypothetical protein